MLLIFHCLKNHSLQARYQRPIPHLQLFQVIYFKRVIRSIYKEQYRQQPMRLIRMQQCYLDKDLNFTKRKRVIQLITKQLAETFKLITSHSIQEQLIPTMIITNSKDI